MSIRNDVWLNSDGLAIGYGTRQTEANTGSVTAALGAETEIVFHVNSETLVNTPSVASAATVPRLPVDAIITSGAIYVEDAFAGTTSLVLTAYDYDSGGDARYDYKNAPTLTSANVLSTTALADIDADGDIVDLSLSEAVGGDATKDGVVIMARVVGNLPTAGRAKVVLTYVTSK